MKRILFLVALSLSYLNINAQTGGIPSGQTIEGVLRNATKRQTSSGGVNLPVLRLVPVTATGVYTSGSSKDQLLMGLFRKMSDGSFALAVDASLLPSGGGGSFTTLSGDVVSQPNGGATTIQPSAVTNGKMANMPANTFKGNNTVSSASPLDLTPAQVKVTLAIKDNDIVTTVSNTIGNTTAPIGTSQLTINNLLNSEKQNNLVSGTNIKTVNGNSLLGSGNITISGGSSIQFQDEGTNTGAAGAATTYNFVGAGVTAAVSGATATITIAGGSGSAFPTTVTSNGGQIKYWTVSGTPTVTFIKASGVGTVAVSGGVIEMDRFQVNLSVPADCAGDGSFTIVAPTTQSGTFLQYPTSHIIYTSSGQAPSVASHTQRSPGSAPLITFNGGTAGVNISMKTGDLNAAGSSATIIQNY